MSPEQPGRKDDVPTAVYPVVADGEAATTVDGPPSGLGRHRRRRQIRAAVGVGALGLTVVVAAIAALGLGGPTTELEPSSGAPPATATVERMTLTQTERLAGTLGYGPVSVLTARASATPPASAGLTAHGLIEPSGTPTPSPTATPSPTPSPDPTTEAPPTEEPSPSPTASPTPFTTNTITWLAPIGTVVARGQPVYKVDNLPVVLLVGDTPLFRVLAEGLVGPDVSVLEANLAALGYAGLTVDESFTAATAAELRRWQGDLGVPQTGTVDVNQVIVVPAEFRVAEHRTTVGSEAAGEVLAYTGTAPLVTLDVPVNRRHLVQVGQSVTLTLPDGGSVTGSVASVGTVAAVSEADTGGGGGALAVPATVTLAEGADLGGFDGAPVGLEIVVAEHADVLTVPVGALVALAEGGYGVQVIEGSTSHYVAVETGMFAMGRVEVTGVEEGTVVGVPA